MLGTPKGLRLHIGLFGNRNAGKSSLINALTNQNISIVSNVPGTTTDPVEKACELAPIGPVVFIDTAGVDDLGELGLARIRRSEQVLEWVDIAVIVLNPFGLSAAEEKLIERAKRLKTPTIVVINQTDRQAPAPACLDALKQSGFTPILTSAKEKTGIDDLRRAIVDYARDRIPQDRLLAGDLVSAGDTVVLVTPIDTGAPKGRLILPQVQTIRELLDAQAKCIVVQQNRVSEILEDLRHPPKLIMCDSQVILDVAKQTPDSIPLTTFSIQMAYAKADVLAMAEGTAALARLEDGDKVLICETCSHHPQKDDIGRVKIPRWLREKTQKDLQIDIAVGKDFPTDLTPYKVLIQCGGCVVTRNHMLARLRQATEQGVPMTNYGMTISYLQGVIERVLLCHPEALDAYRKALCH